MTQLKFNFMDGLYSITDDKGILKTVIGDLIEKLDEEGFNEEEINEFISIKVKRYLGI
jgi:hypothetical protein